ncbi:MAG: D-tyrosyl-tRNA(Tyr) deacylase [Clostridia bacterium]|nr:D-tyrosyl-tRNA(Tyr) deacylase [Clostridia bacterium]
MKAVIQRVIKSSVSVDGRVVGSSGKGYMILVGVTKGDTEKHADLLAKKTAALRVFEDDMGKMNLSVLDVEGDILAISQFTLCADCKKGNRPSFTPSEEPVRANELYELYCQKLSEYGVKRVEKGVFGADMKVELINDGPVTICFDTDIWSV